MQIIDYVYFFLPIMDYVFGFLFSSDFWLFHVDPLLILEIY